MVRERHIDKQHKINTLASHILRLAADQLVVKLRFLDVAVAALTPVPMPELGGVSTDTTHLYYDPVWLLHQYEKEQAYPLRMYLHILLHCIFYHSYRYDKLKTDAWDLAVDLAVEQTILDLEIPGFYLKKDDELRDVMTDLSELMNGKGSQEAYLASVMWNQDGSVDYTPPEHIPFTAEHIYHYLKKGECPEEKLANLRRLSHVDEHISWRVQTELVPGQEQFQKIAQRVKAELKSFSKTKTKAESLHLNLEEATRQRYSYADILRRFTHMAEDMQTNDDEFDYIYYTYGLSTYGNMPLVEPLEYKDVDKVREFVIAVDTSASCRGELIEHFLRQTVAILRQRESFFTKVNIHILQCDMEVRRDVKITCQEDLDAFLKEGLVSGFGATDFRPAFTYVQEQIAQGEFENLKGILYFTDGYGIYPDHMPPFETIFIFLRNDYQKPPVPVWAIEVVLNESELLDIEAGS